MFQDAVSRCIHPSWCEGFCKTVQSCEGFRMSYFFIFQCKTGTARVEIHACSSSCATVQPVSGWQFGCLESGQTVAAVVTMAGAEKCATGLISGWTTGRHLSWCDCIIISPTHHHMHHMLKLRIPHHSPLKSDIFHPLSSHFSIGFPWWPPCQAWRQLARHCDLRSQELMTRIHELPVAWQIDGISWGISPWNPGKSMEIHLEDAWNGLSLFEDSGKANHWCIFLICWFGWWYYQHWSLRRKWIQQWRFIQQWTLQVSRDFLNNRIWTYPPPIHGPFLERGLQMVGGWGQMGND